MSTHVLLTTTKWDTVDYEPTAYLEQDLRKSTWANIIEGGARTCRFLNTHESAWKVVDTLLQRDPLELHIIQQELPDATNSNLPHKRRGFFAFLFSLFALKVRVLSLQVAIS